MAVWTDKETLKLIEIWGKKVYKNNWRDQSETVMFTTRYLEKWLLLVSPDPDLNVAKK